MDATTVAVDLAKDVFQVALANRAGRIIDHQRLTRRQFERFLDTVAVSTEVIMESCGTAHYWGRRAQARGYGFACCRCSTCDRMCGATKPIAWTPKPYLRPPAAARFVRSR